MLKKRLLFIFAMFIALTTWAQGPTLSEGFEGMVFPPDGWTSVNVVDPSNTWVRSTDYSRTGAASAYVSFSNIGSSSENYLVTPKLSINSIDDSISFWARMDFLIPGFDNTFLKLYISTNGNDASDFTDDALLDLSASYSGGNQITETWKRWAISLEDYVGEEIYIAFRQNANGSLGLCLDDVTGPEIATSSCEKPTDITLSNPTTSSIDIEFEPGNVGDASWWLYYRLFNSLDWDSTLLSNNTYTLTGLVHSSTYEVRLRTDCGNTLSDPTSIHTFKTSCDAIIDITWTENFDSYGTSIGTRPDCWSFPVLHDNWPYIVTAKKNSSPASLKFESPMGVHTYAITPQFADDINQLRVSFYLKAEDITSSGTIEVGVMSSATDITTFELVEVIQPINTSFNQYEVGFGGTVLNGPDNYIAFRHNTNSEYYYYWLDDVEVSYMPDCAKPSNLTVSNITESAGDISWTPGNQGDNAWWLYYKEADLSDWDSMEVFNNPYSLSNLIPDTDYEVYIKTICSSDVLEPSAILSFRTTCLPIDGEDDLPWEEGFEPLLANTTLPNCWSATGFGTTTNTQTSNYGAYGRDARTGTGAAYFRWSANDSFTTPPFYLYEGEYYEFSFWYVTDGFDGWQTLKANANLPNGNTITIGDPVNNITNTVYQEYTAIIEALEDGYYSFDIEVNANSSPWYLTIDDVSLKVASGCIRPSTLSVSNITSNSADLEWMAGGGSDFSWWVYLREDGENDWDSVNVLNNPYTWSGLSPNTVYEFYVKTDCDNEVSEPSAIFSFETLCVPIDGEDDLPWEEGFEDLLANTTLPLCWSATNFGTATNTQVSNYNSYNRNARTGTGAAYFRWSANDSFTTPSFYLYEGDSYEFSFWYITDGLNGWQTLKAVLNKPDGSETVLGDIIETPSNTVYEQHSAIFIVEEDGYYSINIAASANSSPYYLTFDDVKLQIEPDCKRPTSILADNITTAQADISWTTGSENDSQWRMYYQKQGDSEWDSITVTNNPYTLTGLSHSTTYNLYIKTDCSGELSEESSIITLRTDCDIISSIPWTEDFDIYGVVANTRPDCWAFPVIYSGYPAIVTGVSNVVSSPGSLRFQSQVGVYTYAITPPFEDDINELRVRFQLRAESISSSGTIEVGVMSDAADTSTFELIEIIQPINTSFNQYEVNFGGASLSGSGRHIAFRHNTVNSSWYYWLDDVIVDYIPACARPYNLSITEISSSTALVSWLSGNQSDDAWWILYKASNGGDWDSLYTNDNPHVLTDLMAATAYEVAIRTDCNDEVSELSIATFFNTSCHDGAIVNFPWEEGFESGLNCWGQENTLGSVVWSNSGSNGQAYTGSGYAYFYNPSSIAASTMLISPVLDISALTSPYLSFWHTQKAWGSDQDELKVLYRESEDDDWEELLHYTDDIQIYQFDSIALPNPSTTYQIAFEGKAAYGYGVNLDDITVYDADADICLPPTNLEVVPYNTTAELSWTASGEELNWEVRLGENGTIEVVTIPSHTITDLTPNTSYTVYVRSNCGGVYSTWLSASFTTTDIIIAPTVTTDEVIVNDVEKTAEFAGTITENTEEVIAKGFEYKTASEDWLDAENLTATGSTAITATTPMLPMGDYLVRAYAETASGKTYGEELDFEITSSLSSIDIDNLDITLYPNPATSTTTISIKGVDGKVIISIIDIQGRTITSVDKNSSNNEIKHSFDLEGLAKGVYYIRVDAKNSIKTQKLIVQ